MNRRALHIPEPFRGLWLIGTYPAIVAALLHDPAGAIAAHGLVPLLTGLVVLGVVQVFIIVAEMRAKRWIR